MCVCVCVCAPHPPPSTPHCHRCSYYRCLLLICTTHGGCPNVQMRFRNFHFALIIYTRNLLFFLSGRTKLSGITRLVPASKFMKTWTKNSLLDEKLPVRLSDCLLVSLWEQRDKTRSSVPYAILFGQPCGADMVM